MKRTVEEKRKYHSRGFPKGQFSQGYIIGVTLYQNYGKGGSPVHKEKRAKYVDAIKTQAKAGDTFSKGVMCGIRDSANERKERQREKFPSNSLTPRRGVAPCKGVKRWEW